MGATKWRRWVSWRGVGQPANRRFYRNIRHYGDSRYAENCAHLGRVSNRTKCDLKSDMAEALPGASNRTGRGLVLSAPNRRISLFTTSAVLRPLTTYGVRTKWGWYGKRPDLLRNFRSGTQAKPSWFCADELRRHKQPDARAQQQGTRKPLQSSRHVAYSEIKLRAFQTTPT